MKFTAVLVAAWSLSLESASAFSPAGNRMFAVGRVSSASVPSVSAEAKRCPSHGAVCNCGACRGAATALFSTEEQVDPEVPPEVEALDGVESEQEAHNVERPARQQIKKKRGSKGKPLSEFEQGATVTGKVRSVTSYGAFVDFGAESDGLLHISQLAAGYVESVEAIVKEGQEVEVRILNIDTAKKQVALSMMSEEEEASQASAQRDRPQRQQRRDDREAIASLAEKGWDTTTFVEGTVVSIADFGAFVRFDVSALNSECEGQIDGLVHISTLSTTRVNSVDDVVSVNDKLQVRLKSVDGRKVSLTALSVEDEAAKAEARNTRVEEVAGAADWAEQLKNFREKMPEFKNRPEVVDLRK